jgi:hypothetical protein
MTMAIRADGTVWTWGSLGSAGTGNGFAGVLFATHYLPEQVGVPPGNLSTHPGNQSGTVLRDDGSVWNWGGNQPYGNLGRNGGAWFSPQPIADLPEILIMSGPAVAVTQEGAVWTWGVNLGDGSYPTVYRWNPAPNGLDLGVLEGLEDDPDGDTLTTRLELLIGTDPYEADTNANGIDDATERLLGGSAGDLNSDGDVLTDREELLLGTDPLHPDTDRDGVIDGLDAYPFDPTRWEEPQPDQGDTIPPTIILTDPSNAVLVSSIP